MDIDFGTTSADEAEAMEVDEAPTSRDWRVQYLDWIIRGVLPSNRAQARRLARRAKSFVLINDALYKRSPSGVMQRCIPVPEGKELIRDIHAGICGHHAVPGTLGGRGRGNVDRRGSTFVRLARPVPRLDQPRGATLGPRTGATRR